MSRPQSRWFLAAFTAAALLSGAASAATSSLNFLPPSQNWGIIASSNPLPYGSTLNIYYDIERLTSCRGTINGTTPGWVILGHYQFNGGTVQSFWVAGYHSEPFPAAPSIPLNTRGTLSIWFENNNRWGCQAWDSDFGNNFNFTVQ